MIGWVAIWEGLIRLMLFETKPGSRAYIDQSKEEIRVRNDSGDQGYI